MQIHYRAVTAPSSESPVLRLGKQAAPLPHDFNGFMGQEERDAQRGRVAWSQSWCVPVQLSLSFLLLFLGKYATKKLV